MNIDAISAVLFERAKYWEDCMQIKVNQVNLADAMWFTQQWKNCGDADCIFI